jgi:hypothetical protein
MLTSHRILDFIVAAVCRQTYKPELYPVLKGLVCKNRRRLEKRIPVILVHTFYKKNLFARRMAKQKETGGTLFPLTPIQFFY